MDELERRAVVAALAVAADHGACGVDAAVIYSGSNVVIRLPGQSAVARVMSGTVVLHDDPRRWLEREISVVRFLADSGLAVLPSLALSPGPHLRDGLWMTFAEWVPDAEPAPERGRGVSVEEAGDFGRSLHQLHRALRPFDGDLGGLSDLRDDIERLADHLQPAGGGQGERVRWLRDELSRVGPAVFDATLPVQALHGDVSLRNLLRTPAGWLWNDFEDTFRGPVHWDLASAIGSLRSHGAGTQAVGAMLDAYGWQDEAALAPFLAVQDVYDEIWQLFDEQRR